MKEAFTKAFHFFQQKISVYLVKHLTVNLIKLTML